eukprot:m.354076 g.354076  ORF g.354076 m.354076 type:complete len:306 (-) comp16915_c0_seq1:176-1093(-)
MAHRGTDTAYGDLAERRQRMDSKYDPEVEKIHVKFLEKNTGEKMQGTFQEWLKSGVVLCKLMNALAPKSIKTIHESGLAFKQMENISNFLTALPGFGVRVEDVFQTADLYEGVNMTAVQVCIESVRRTADMKSKGVSVAAQAPTRAQVKLPDGAASLGEAKPAGKHATIEMSTAKFATANASGEYGDLAERKARLSAKYDKGLEAELRAWIEAKTGETLADDFHEALRDGQVLCKLANAIKPGSITSINNSKMAFKQMENINRFLDFCRSQGVGAADLFQTVALYEAENMTQVCLTISNLKRITS